jgi:hypothetical protein
MKRKNKSLETTIKEMNEAVGIIGSDKPRGTPPAFNSVYSSTMGNQMSASRGRTLEKRAQPIASFESGGGSGKVPNVGDAPTTAELSARGCPESGKRKKLKEEEILELKSTANNTANTDQKPVLAFPQPANTATSNTSGGGILQSLQDFWERQKAAAANSPEANQAQPETMMPDWMNKGPNSQGVWQGFKDWWMKQKQNTKDFDKNYIQPNLPTLPRVTPAPDPVSPTTPAPPSPTHPHRDTLVPSPDDMYHIPGQDTVIDIAKYGKYGLLGLGGAAGLWALNKLVGGNFSKGGIGKDGKSSGVIHPALSQMSGLPTKRVLDKMRGIGMFNPMTQFQGNPTQDKSQQEEFQMENKDDKEESSINTKKRRKVEYIDRRNLANDRFNYRSNLGRNYVAKGNSDLDETEIRRRVIIREAIKDKQQKKKLKGDNGQITGDVTPIDTHPVIKREPVDSIRG